MPLLADIVSKYFLRFTQQDAGEQALGMALENGRRPARPHRTLAGGSTQLIPTLISSQASRLHQCIQQRRQQSTWKTEVTVPCDRLRKHASVSEVELAQS